MTIRAFIIVLKSDQRICVQLHNDTPEINVFDTPEILHNDTPSRGIHGSFARDPWLKFRDWSSLIIECSAHCLPLLLPQSRRGAK